MNAAHPIFDLYSRPHSLDFSDNLLAFPSCGSLFARLKAALGNWAQAALEEQADARLWSAPARDARVHTEIARAAERNEEPIPKRPQVLSVASDRKPLNDGWAQIIEHAYQTRFHSNGAQHA